MHMCILRVNRIPKVDMYVCMYVCMYYIRLYVHLRQY